MRTGSFPGVKSGRGVTLTPHPLPVLWSRKCRAIPLLPLWAVRPVHSLSACTRVHFTSQLLSSPFDYNYSQFDARNDIRLTSSQTTERAKFINKSKTAGG